MDYFQVQTVTSLATDITTNTSTDISPETSQVTVSEKAIIATTKPSNSVSKDAIRNSLKISTIDGVFAAVFSITTTGILLSNFLVELDASPVVFGMLSSIPMLVNLIQPLGAYLSERSTSRYHYSMWTYGISRLLWLILVIGITASSCGLINRDRLVILTLVILLASHLLGGLGSASWLSWMATLVHRRLRGRYFGIRNSAASLTNLICVPLVGLAVSNWYGGTLQGYGVVLFAGILSGLMSLVCQQFKVDINPKSQNALFVNNFKKKTVSLVANNQNLPLNAKTESENALISSNTSNSNTSNSSTWKSVFNDSNFLMFLLYFSLWMLAVNLSAPFFNFYMLDTLDLDVSWVTLYSSIQAGANLLMMILWGKLADKIGNRPILILIGILVAITPLLWLGIGTNHFDIWLGLPLLHILTGGTWAAIDLCSNNMQLSVAPVKNQSIYFAIAAAVGGVTGALGTTIGGLLVQFANYGGLPGLFVLSALCRLLALIPLFFVKEPGRQSWWQIIQPIWQFPKKLAQS
jgi:MFS family permease